MFSGYGLSISIFLVVRICWRAMACSARDVEERLCIALKKLENCVEYLALAFSRDGFDNPSMRARESCYSSYGKPLVPNHAERVCKAA